MSGPTSWFGKCSCCDEITFTIRKAEVRGPRTGGFAHSPTDISNARDWLNAIDFDSVWGAHSELYARYQWNTSTNTGDFDLFTNSGVDAYTNGSANMGGSIYYLTRTWLDFGAQTVDFTQCLLLLDGGSPPTTTKESCVTFQDSGIVILECPEIPSSGYERINNLLWFGSVSSGLSYSSVCTDCEPLDP